MPNKLVCKISIAATELKGKEALKVRMLRVSCFFVLLYGQ